MLICKGCSQFHCSELTHRGLWVEESWPGYRASCTSNYCTRQCLCVFMCEHVCVWGGTWSIACLSWKEASFIQEPAGYQLEEQRETKHWSHIKQRKENDGIATRGRNTYLLMGNEKKNIFKTQQVIEMEGWEYINFKGTTVLLLWYMYQSRSVSK